MTDTISTAIPLDRLGHPGIAGELLFLDIFPGEKRTDQERLKDKSEREFLVQARLSNRPESNEELTAQINPEHGGSCFLAHPDAVITKIYSPIGPFEIFHNQKRELSVVKFTCTAVSTTDARQKFLDGVMPLFDYLCFKSNLPLYIPLIVCEDSKNRIRAFDYVTPYPRATINPHVTQFASELRPLYAIYREAKNAQSPFYKFLCYFKILEGIYRHIRGGTAKMARANGIEIPTRKEIVPPHPELDQILVGKPIGPLFNDRFEKNFRDRVAHCILDSGAILNVSDYGESQEFARELLLLELCTRVVLETQEEYCIAASQRPA